MIHFGLKYVLVGQTPVIEPDVEKWARWYERSMVDGSSIVARTEVGASLISTVFLGLNHRFTGDGLPLLFETMIFTDGAPEDFQRRCSTWQEAEAQHKRAVQERQAAWKK